MASAATLGAIARRRPQGLRRTFGWRRGLAVIAALLAVLTVIVSAPEHVLEREEGPPAATAAGVLPGVVVDHRWDHRAPGHVCADHCAAHVLAQAPGMVEVRRVPPLRAAWLRPRPAQGRSAPATVPDHRPRA